MRAAHSSWLVAGVLASAYAVAFLDRAMVSVAGAPIKRDLALSDSQFGLLSGTAFAILFGVAGLPLGWLADRTDRRRMIALAILLWTAMTALCGFADSFPAFFAARVGVGLTEAALVPAAISLLGVTVPAPCMARAIAIFLMGAALGNAAALIGGGYLLSRLAVDPLALPGLGPLAPWRTLFLLAGLPGLGAATLVLLLPEPGRDGARLGGKAALRAAASHIVARPAAYGLLAAATCCTLLLSQAQGAWMPLFFVRRFGLEPGPSAALVGLLYLISVPTGQFAGGVLTDCLRARGTAAAPHAAIALCAGLSLPPAILFCTTMDLRLAQAGYALFSFLAAAATPNGLLGLQLLTPRRFQGTASALLVSLVSLVGVGLGPAAVGLLVDQVFQDEQALGQALLVVLAAAAVAAPLLAMLGRAPFAIAVQPAEGA